MKILVVCQHYSPEPFRISNLCGELVKSGHDITVLTGLPNYPDGIVKDDYRHGKRREETLDGVKIIRTFEIGRGKGNIKRFLNYFSYAFSATIKAKKLPGDFDLVLVYQLSPVMMAWPAIAYKKKYNKKMFLYCLDLWPDSLVAGGIKRDSLVYKCFFKISTNIYNTADVISVTSSMFIDYFLETHHISKEKLVYIPQYAEDIYQIDSLPTIKKNTYNFVFAGNIGEMQSVETIVKAALLLKNRKDVIIHIVGDGSKLEECKHLAEGLNNVVFHGRRPIEEMPYFYEFADAMLVSLKSDSIISSTLPGKIQSYMAAGKPIIASAGGEIEHLIKEANCGYCSKSDDPEALSKCIYKFIYDGKAMELGSNSKKYYNENFAKEKVMGKIENMLYAGIN